MWLGFDDNAEHPERLCPRGKNNPYNRIHNLRENNYYVAIKANIITLLQSEMVLKNVLSKP